MEQRYAEEDEDDFTKDNWRVEDFSLKVLAPSLYLVNYTLYGQGRITKRGEIWKGDLENGLKVMYHQGTIVIPERIEEHKQLLEDLKNK